MITTFALETTQRLELRSSPDLIAYAELLALPAAELELTIERELELNPALERVERVVCPFCGEPYGGTRCPVCARPGRQPSSIEREPIEAPAEVSAEDEFLADLRPLLPPGDATILEHVLGSLDERGFIDAGPDEIAAMLSVSQERVDRVLAAVQLHGPPGLAATGLRECMLLQLDRLDETPEAALAREVVADHLELLASRRWRRIADALGVSHDEVTAAAEFIRTRLRPSAPLECSERTWSAPPALPDVIIRERNDGSGTFTVELAEPRRLGVGLAPAYLRADGDDLDPEAQSQIESALTEARVFLRRLDRRWQTMRAISEYVVGRQHEFVANGPRAIAPLTRAEVAAELGIHESTVSRATRGRYVLLPSGRVVPFSRFFDAALGPCAALAQLVAAERSPRSDSDLASELAELGFAVARRTVAKYRDRLGIPPHTQR